MKNKFRNVICIVCCIVFVISLAYIVQYFCLKQKEIQSIKEVQIEKEKNEIKNEIPQEDIVSFQEDISLDSQEESLEILEDYKSLYQQNNDLYGWIEIKDTNINYPVMYTPEEPNFYVYNDWNKEYSKYGSIYIDGRCNDESNNLIIYGHNMKDLSMFGCLSYYKKESFYNEHMYIEFDTLYEKATYEIIAVSQAFIKEEALMSPTENNNSEIPYKEVSDDEYLFYEHIALKNEKEFEDYLHFIKENSYYKIDVDAAYGDKLITLCTCTNTKVYQNERLLIVAKKI